jgi:hypothetical protein
MVANLEVLPSRTCRQADGIKSLYFPEYPQSVKGFTVTDDRMATSSAPGPEDPEDTAGAGIDTTVPHSARIWNYWLGGKDNYAVDGRQATNTSRSTPASSTSPVPAGRSWPGPCGT